MKEKTVSKNFIKIAPELVIILLIINILLCGFVVSRYQAANDAKSTDNVVSMNVTGTIIGTTQPTSTKLTPTTTAKVLAVNWGTRISGTVEKIDIYADPITASDSVAMLRFYVKNGEVLNFVTNGLISLGACADNQKFTTDHVCVDVAKTTPFVKGEIIATVTIKWADNGEIYLEEGDGYYNGKDESFIISMAESTGKVAGVSTSTSEYLTEGVVLIVAGAVILFVAMICAYLILNRNKQKTNVEDFRKNTFGVKTMVIISFVILAGATIYVADRVITQNQAATDTNALTTTVYVTVTAAATTNTPTPTVTLIPTLTTTPKNTTTGTPITTITLTATVTNTPVVTPITDNVPVVCGALDANADKILNYIDYQAMIVVYNHQCSDNYPKMGCGGKDTNGDGIVNYIDLFYLVNHQYPDYIDCTIY